MLGPEDYLLEVGCGGGAFLDDARRSGCKAAAIDHSSDMVGLARKVNHEAIQENRLEVHEGEADSLPYPGGLFTCAVMTGVFGFIPDPLKALSGIRQCALIMVGLHSSSEQKSYEGRLQPPSR